jgi:transcriptional regulator with XRE-family HTH domain
MAELRAVVAGNIRAGRARARLRQVELGQVLGLSQSATSMLEAGQRDITLSEALAICRAFGVPLASLVEGADAEDLQDLGL